MKTSLLLISFVILSCSSHCYRAYYMPNCRLANPEVPAPTLNERSRSAINRYLTIPHYIVNGEKIVVVFRELNDDQFLIDDESFKMVTLEIPKDSLKKEGELNPSSRNGINVVISEGGIQWLETACVGSAKSGSIIYKQTGDSTIWLRINLTLDLHSVSQRRWPCSNKFIKEATFRRINKIEQQQIPNYPCPKMN